MSDYSDRVYRDAQKACGLKKGDWVKVIESVPEWPAWSGKSMDETVGSVGKIVEVYLYSIEVDFEDCRFCYPYFVLEKIEQPCPFKEGDYVKIIGKGSMTSDIVKATVIDNTLSYWNPNMNETIGMVGRVSKLPDKYGKKYTVLVNFPDGRTWIYAWDCLEKVDKPERVFKPFERVLVRNSEVSFWSISLYGNKGEEWHMCTNGASWKYCIPYEGNEHLVGTTDSPKEVAYE